jgi:hypothetical protein
MVDIEWLGRKNKYSMKSTSLLLSTAMLLCLCIAATAQTIPPYVPTDGLVGWWPFNGNANDESGNGNNGSVNGATLTEDRFGAVNAAYDFDGISNFIRVADADILDLTQNFTLSAWIVSETRDFEQGILGKGKIESQTGYALLHSAYLQLSGVGIQNIPNPASECYVPNTEIPLQQWTSIIGTFNGSDLKLFLNGIEVLSISSILELMPNSLTDLFFGCELSNYRFFKGKIDDVGMFNRALTQEEITDLYKANLCYEYITVTDTLIINLNPTGFNPVTYANTILMYPNPTSEELTINYGDFASLAGYTLKIFNSIGQEIHSVNINQQQEVLQLGSWGGAGTYQVVIYNAQGVPVDTRAIVLQ